MSNRKDSSPMAQKTLLSFFKPKTNDSTATATRNSTPSSISPEVSKKHTPRGNKRSGPNDSDPSEEWGTSKRTRLSQGAHGTTARDVDMEESLFPVDLESRVGQVLSSPPAPSMVSSTSKDESTSQPKPSKRKAATKGISTLSRFKHQDSDIDMDQEDLKAMDAEERQAKDERHEKFLKKLGNLAAPETIQDVVQGPSAPRRRRLIVESDDEDTTTMKVNEDPDEAMDQDNRSGKDSTGNSRVQGTTKQQQQSSFKLAALSNLSNETTSSKKTTTKNTYTPLEKQFIEIKGQYPDAVLCIEVGYKFRFFDKDAQIASRELSIAHFMDHNFYTASIPVHRLDVHVRRLVHAGYKVGVVRQMETAALKSAGDNKSAPFTRKLTNLYTKATFLESLDQDEEQFQTNFASHGPSSQYLMGIYEQPQGGGGVDEKVKISIIGVQPATGDIIYDEFVDGHFRNELETRLLHIQPAELIVPLETMSKATEKLIGHLTAPSHRRPGSLGRGHDDVRIERTEGFVKYDTAFKLVSEFYSTNLKDKPRHSAGDAKAGVTQQHMEALLKTVLGLSRNLIITLSAMITHLTDFGLAPIFRLSKYFECFTSRSHMLLNGNTISNLEIFRNQTDWTTQGSLFAILDHTMTGFGRRLLKKWVGKPLVDRKALQERVDAVEEILALAGKNAYLHDARETLKGLMDLEKGVCRIHYGKSSPKEFLAIMKTFMKISEVIPSNERSKSQPDFGLTNPVLRYLIGSLSNATEDTRYFLRALNEQAADKNDKLFMFQDDTIIAKWPEIQEHRDNIALTESDLSTHLEVVRKRLHEPKLEFSSVSGIDYLIEVKNKDVAKVPKSWVKISGTKQVSRFHTPEIVQLVQSKAQHQERLVLACDRAFAAFQQELSERYEVFRDLVQNLAMLDCLFSLSAVASLPGYVKPEYVDDIADGNRSIGLDDNRQKAQDVGSGGRTSKVTLDITNGRHPMVEQLLLPDNFVPNDIHFGTRDVTGIDEKTIVLTGPNMGGKSCYIRQVALLCIMAQIGSYVPADSARVSLLDAVYTRMGASDNIFGHESTFMVELQETSDILKVATSRSLVILDELGRGTSTLDGVAIAYAVLKHVVSNIGAITLFVTHYPSLSEVAKEFPEGMIRNYHMGFMASARTVSGSEHTSEMETGRQPITASEVDSAAANESSSTSDLDDMDIVFLYKLVPGVSMKSYGLNVARMAKLPLSLITKAKVKSKELETILERRVQLRRQDQARLEASDKDQDRAVSLAKEIHTCATEDGAQDLVQKLRSWRFRSET
ncbi:Mismatch repair protein msh3 [Mortierella sp. GBA43]|nr:Mismatch repair protein msh3 [Mortierella sp. GBA43]